MLDEFKVALPSGFPDHPHAGMQTVTFLLPDGDPEGCLEHEDFNGHKGLLRPGGVQYMTAGRAVAHAEVPTSTTPAHGLQLWVNLSKKHKKGDSDYQEFSWEDCPRGEKDGVSVAVIAGNALGVESPTVTKTPTHYAYVTMEPGSEFVHEVDACWNVFAYTLEGDLEVDRGSESREIAPAHHIVTYPGKGSDEGKPSTLRFGVPSSQTGKTKFVLIGGKPLGEPVVARGPMVGSSQSELMGFFESYWNGSNGFEKNVGWRSSIAKRVRH